MPSQLEMSPGSSSISGPEMRIRGAPIGNFPIFIMKGYRLLENAANPTLPSLGDQQGIRNVEVFNAGAFPVLGQPLFGL